ncbi:MerR family DNA-binding transcriptional regulator [Sulfobacillus thermosulfidooxidans]|uniref:MerR family DNA-binding transcriptional regulator n=1 Tax=Sulfobacillus thermosulfidooxidans TaxID=28034 RepID=UPI0006B4E92B|nr:MerR family DNA-binding transcriptional regulator [Sulfobacillus thermosulfidooxidans]
MKSSQWLTIGQAAQRLGVSPQTLRRWERQGKIHAVRSPTNRRLYAMPEVQRLLSPVSSARCVIYARVTPAPTEPDLAEQLIRCIDYAGQHGYDVIRVFQEQGNGDDDNRPVLHEVLCGAQAHEFQIVLVSSPDRLALHGYGYLERLFEAYGVRVVWPTPSDADRPRL